MPRGRFAPSPTGLLHLGSARTALAAWLAARSTGSSFVLRFEDLDRPRAVPGAIEAIAEDLRWLGLDWDEQYLQSQRLPLYEGAIERLNARGRTFPCWCSRADILRAVSAPHEGEEGPRYPGTCRAAAGEPGLGPRPSIRLRVDPGQVCFEDAVCGRCCQDVSQLTGDFVLRRADGIFAYQLAVVVDDIDLGIEEVVRGADLLASTPRQILLYRALGAEPPRFAHVPLLLGPDGQRLSKRHGDVSLRRYRAEDTAAAELTGRLAAGLGLCESGQAVTPAELLGSFSWARLRRQLE